MIRRLLQMVGGPALLVGCYLGFHWLFAQATEEDGLLTPATQPPWEVIFLGLWVIGLRLVVLFGVPLVLVYRLTKYVSGANDQQRGSS